MGSASSTVIVAPSGDPLLALDGVPDDDAGILTDPAETARGSTDSTKAVVAARVRRNMLPCSPEIAAEAVAARPALWRGLFMKILAGPAEGRQGELKGLTVAMAEIEQPGLIQFLRQPRAESFCGSCDRQRGEQHDVTKKRAVCYSNHPTAPPLLLCLMLEALGALAFVAGFIA